VYVLRPLRAAGFARAACVLCGLLLVVRQSFPEQHSSRRATLRSNA